MASGHQFEALSRKVIAACIDVQRQLGTRCKETDYQRALEIALPKYGVQFEREVEVPISYDDITITRRRVDFLCWDERDKLLLETKAIPALRLNDVKQCLFYLTKGDYKISLLVNFGQKPIRPRRFVHNPKPAP
jgi:GxxExxY protein